MEKCYHLSFAIFLVILIIDQDRNCRDLAQLWPGGLV